MGIKYLIGLCVLCSGCSMVADATRNIAFETAQCVDRARDRSREDRLAREALACHKCRASSDDYACGYKNGFVGYLEHGGNGEPPPVPPSQYWKRRYQTPEGAQCVQEWFEGYRQGASDARQRGYHQPLVEHSVSHESNEPPHATTTYPPAAALPEPTYVSPAPAPQPQAEDTLPRPRPLPKSEPARPTGPAQQSGSPRPIAAPAQVVTAPKAPAIPDQVRAATRETPAPAGPPPLPTILTGSSPTNPAGVADRAPLPAPKARPVVQEAPKRPAPPIPPKVEGGPGIRVFGIEEVARQSPKTPAPYGQLLSAWMTAGLPSPKTPVTPALPPKAEPVPREVGIRVFVKPPSAPKAAPVEEEPGIRVFAKDPSDRSTLLVPTPVGQKPADPAWPRQEGTAAAAGRNEGRSRLLPRYGPPPNPDAD